MGREEKSFKSSLSDKVLSMSNRYAFYKREYERLADENKNLKKDIQRLKAGHDDVDALKRNMNNSFYYLEGINVKFDREQQYAFVFNDTIRESEWLINKDFSLINAAANYSLAYSLYRILNDAQPKSILELGLGQTTKITTQYVNHFDDADLSVIEADQDWIDVFAEKLNVRDNADIIHRDLEIVDYKDKPTLRFKDLGDVVGDKKFDLIIIDGPQGHLPGESVDLDYPRTNILDLIPNNLADDFIIIMDDYNRAGERNTMDDVEKLLKDNGIEFFEYTCNALKSQHAVFSEKFKFISWI